MTAPLCGACKQVPLQAAIGLKTVAGNDIAADGMLLQHNRFLISLLLHLLHLLHPVNEAPMVETYHVKAPAPERAC